MVYTGEAQPYSLIRKTAIAPDRGSVNPWSGAPTPIAAPERNFTLLVLPEGVDPGDTAESLQQIAGSNVLRSPSDTKDGPMWILANRVYMAFEGYDRGGTGGPDDSPFPAVRPSTTRRERACPAAHSTSFPTACRLRRRTRRRRARRCCATTSC